MFDFLRRDKKDPKKELLDLVGEYELPSFSQSVMNILKAIRDPDFKVSEVTEQLEIDPGLHVKVLALVNSAAFGMSQRVNNLRQAVSLLGKSRLEAVVLSQAVNQSLPKVNCPFFDVEEFWFTAARRASLARSFASHLHPLTQTEAFTIALLQDMGLPVMVSACEKQMEAILRLWKEDRDSTLKEVEREALEYDHFAIGALMAEAWALPHYLVHAVARVDLSKVPDANQLVGELRLDDDEEIREVLLMLCQSRHQMTPDQILSCIEQGLEAANELQNMFH